MLAARADATADERRSGRHRRRSKRWRRRRTRAKARAATPKATTEKASGEGKDQGSDMRDAVYGDDWPRRRRPRRWPRVDGVAGRPRRLAAASSRRPSTLLPRVAPESPAAIDAATESMAEDGDAAATVGTATRYSLGHARGMRSVDAANDRRASPVDATRDTALRVAADARVQLASDDTLPPASTRPPQRPRTTAASMRWPHRSASAQRRTAPTRPPPRPPRPRSRWRRRSIRPTSPPRSASR